MLFQTVGFGGPSSFPCLVGSADNPASAALASPAFSWRAFISSVFGEYGSFTSVFYFYDFVDRFRLTLQLAIVGKRYQEAGDAAI